MKKTLINPQSDMPLYKAWRYSQAVRVGNMVHTAGIVGFREPFLPADGMEAQAHFAFQSLRRILEECGGSLADVIEVTSFHLDLRGEYDQFEKVKDQYFLQDYPAWTAVGVAQLAMPEIRVEIRAIAALPHA
jgi:enamine deaminase RidA (YjgF/YER057c/UK114 family)